VKSTLGLLLASFAVALGAMVAPAAAETVTVGANLNSPPGFAGEGTCAFDDPGDRPCVIVSTRIAGSANLTAPCDGTVVRFRLNGHVKPGNSYSIRVMRRSSAGSEFTSLTKSAAVQIQQEGINEYATSLPIAAGDYVGIDFESSSEDEGLRWVFDAGLYEELVYRPFDPSGTDSTPDFIEGAHYLFNADVECKGSGQSQGPPTVPNNSFTIGKVVGRSVLVDIASTGLVQISDATKRGKAKASAKGKKGKPKLLRPSSAHGGAGAVKVPLKLTKAAKAILNEKGKVKVKALVVFTPDGGTAASQVKKLTIKRKRPASKGKTGK
jgi:hypothetical protein